MNITFESANIGQKDAHALIAFLTALYPLPATPSIPSSLPPAPPAPPVEMPQTTSEPTPPTPIDQPTTQRKRRTKAEIAADEAAAQQAQAPPANPPNASLAPAAEASATTQSATATSPTVGADELRSLLDGYIAKHSMEEAIGKLREFNCNRVTEALSLPADQLSLLAAALRG